MWISQIRNDVIKKNTIARPVYFVFIAEFVTNEHHDTQLYVGETDATVKCFCEPNDDDNLDLTPFICVVILGSFGNIVVP